MRVGFLAIGSVLSLIGAAGVYTIWNNVVAHCPALDICTTNPATLSAGTSLLTFGSVLVLLAFVLKTGPPSATSAPDQAGLIQSFRCHRCGILNAVGSQFCVRCGASL